MSSAVVGVTAHAVVANGWQERSNFLRPCRAAILARCPEETREEHGEAGLDAIEKAGCSKVSAGENRILND